MYSLNTYGYACINLQKYTPVRLYACTCIPIVGLLGVPILCSGSKSPDAIQRKPLPGIYPPPFTLCTHPMAFPCTQGPATLSSTSSALSPSFPSLDLPTFLLPYTKDRADGTRAALPTPTCPGPLWSRHLYATVKTGVLSAGLPPRSSASRMPASSYCIHYSHSSIAAVVVVSINVLVLLSDLHLSPQTNKWEIASVRLSASPVPRTRARIKAPKSRLVMRSCLFLLNLPGLPASVENTTPLPCDPSRCFQLNIGPPYPRFDSLHTSSPPAATATSPLHIPTALSLLPLDIPSHGDSSFLASPTELQAGRG